MTSKVRRKISECMVEMHRVKKEMVGVTDPKELFALETDLKDLKILAEKIRYGLK